MEKREFAGPWVRLPQFCLRGLLSLRRQPRSPAAQVSPRPWLQPVPGLKSMHSVPVEGALAIDRPWGCCSGTQTRLLSHEAQPTRPGTRSASSIRAVPAVPAVPGCREEEEAGVCVWGVPACLGICKSSPTRPRPAPLFRNRLSCFLCSCSPI